MAWSDDREVPVVEGDQLLLAEALDQSNYVRVDDAEVQVSVAVLQLAAAPKIGGGGRLVSVGPLQQVIEKDQPRLRAETPLAPVVEFGEDEPGYHQIFVCLGADARAPS